MANKDLIINNNALTLGDIICTNRITGDIEIINECNETLVTLAYMEDNVCNLNKLLKNSLLSRCVLSQGVRDGRLLIQIEGVDDAD